MNSIILIEEYINEKSNMTKSLPEFIKKIEFHLEELICKKKSTTFSIRQKTNENGVLLQSNDYLAISNHDYIRKVYVDTLNNNKKDVVMSAIFLHKDDDHSFEHQLANYTGFEALYLVAIWLGCQCRINSNDLTC